MSQQSKLGTTATSLWVSSDGWTRVKYHDTTIIKWNEDSIVLDSGGWMTATTRRRMNQAAKQFKLSFRLVQQDSAWLVVLGAGRTLNFSDGMTIAR